MQTLIDCTWLYPLHFLGHFPLTFLFKHSAHLALYINVCMSLSQGSTSFHWRLWFLIFGLPCGASMSTSLNLSATGYGPRDGFFVHRGELEMLCEMKLCPWNHLWCERYCAGPEPATHPFPGVHIPGWGEAVQPTERRVDLVIVGKMKPES